MGLNRVCATVGQSLIQDRGHPSPAGAMMSRADFRTEP